MEANGCNGSGGSGKGKKEAGERRPVHAVCTLLVMYFTSTFGTLFMLFPYIPLVFVNRRLFHVLSDFSLNIWFGLSVVSPVSFGPTLLTWTVF